MTKEQLEKLKIGDVVRLNSGGNKMTVTQIEINMLAVVWHDDTGVLHSKGGLDYALFSLATREKLNVDTNMV